MSEKCENPCATCPFLTKNHGRENPNGFTEKKKNDKSLIDWYDSRNLTRLWRDGIRKGEAMLCHSSDPEAAKYGGTNAKKGHEKLCTGSVILVYKHLKFLERTIKKLENPKLVQQLYRAKAGKYPMTKEGQAIWLWNFAIGKTNVFNGLIVPKIISREIAEQVTTPPSNRSGYEGSFYGLITESL